MIPRLAALAISILALPTAIQAQGAIPQPVIDQCNSTAKASELPNCLKNGAVGFEMLELLRSEDFYGAAAAPVIDACSARNDSFATTWLCFQRAASDASEAGSLIGRDNIADRCVAEISDPDLEERIGQIYKSKREERFPNEMFFGGQMFYPFQGCPEPAAQEGTTDAPSDTATTGAAETELDTAACMALGEVKGLIQTSSANELREFGADLKAMDDPDPREYADTFGFSVETAKYLLAGGEEHGMTIATSLGAFIDEHHPDLLMEFFKQHETPVSDTTSQMGDEIARGFLAMFIEAARERYNTSCES